MQIQTSPTLAQPQARTATPSRSQKGIGEAIDSLTVSAFTLGTDALDATMGVGYGLRGFPPEFQAAGYAFGAGHCVATIGYLFSCDGKSRDEVRHRIATAVGHGLSAAGHIAGAAGAGA